MFLRFMNYFVKFYPSVMTGLILFCLISSLYLIRYHRALFMCLIGHGRIQNQLLDAKVLVDGAEQPDGKVFRYKDGQNDEKFLVYLANNNKTDSVIIVDKTKNNIGITNSGEENYELFLNRFLFQKDSAYAIVYASSAKWGLDPKLEVTDSKISYVTRNYKKDDSFAEIKTEIFFDN